ncbi:MAG: bifunctional methionine sulfoxide reductase B/A protein [Candidatus Absconditabacterales bacterium]
MTDNVDERNKLTPEQERTIVHKDTEYPDTGELLHEARNGTFACRRCDTPLYASHNKFDAHCGWPSFDEAIPGNVERVADEDGDRTEIVCAHCGAHLGHVFVGEQMTETNTRHCVNSISMKFIPEILGEVSRETIYFGGGCFWCIEAVLQRLKGVLDVKSGYMGGKRKFPTYEQVCTGASGHIEVVKVVFDAAVLPLDVLLSVFFASHDPTSVDKQGHDAGEQYRSVIFYSTSEQEKIIHTKLEQLEEDSVYTAPIVTHILPAEVFYIAEGYHQNFYNQNQQKPYCQIVISPKIKKLRDEFADRLKY